MSDFLFFDLETTSLNPMTGEIITGYFIHTDNKLTKRAEFKLQTKPEVWSKDAEKVHGISKAKASTFPSLRESIDALMSWAPKTSTLVCHASYNFNYYFDCAFLQMALHRLDRTHDYWVRFPNRKSTVTMARQVLKRQKGNDLKSLCDKLNIKLERHHDAKQDAIACYEVFKELSRIQRELRGGLIGALPD